MIRIASSIAPSSDSINSDKYPSSPPLGPSDPEVLPTSSPPLLPVPGASRKVLAPSQISTVAGTQGGWLKREGLETVLGAGLDTSTPPLPPSTSSPMTSGGMRIKVMDSEDEEEEVVFADDGDDDGDLDVGVSFWGRGEDEERNEDADEVMHEENEAEEDEDEEDEGDTTIRDLRDILPDTLLDFSLPPPPPTQSSVRSSWR